MSSPADQTPKMEEGRKVRQIGRGEESEADWTRGGM